VMHMADNYLDCNFVAPGGAAVDQSEDSYTTQLVDAAHPIALGPDRTPNTDDDLTSGDLADPLEFQAQGVLVLPGGATPVLLSPSSAARPATSSWTRPNSRAPW